MRNHEAELRELMQGMQDSVRTAVSDVIAAAGSTGAKLPSDLAELETLLRKLEDQLSDVMDEAEGAVASHPVSSVGVAFLLGFAIGRLSKRSVS